MLLELVCLASKETKWHADAEMKDGQKAREGQHLNRGQNYKQVLLKYACLLVANFLMKHLITKFNVILVFI